LNARHLGHSFPSRGGCQARIRRYHGSGHGQALFLSCPGRSLPRPGATGSGYFFLTNRCSPSYDGGAGRNQHPGADRGTTMSAKVSEGPAGHLLEALLDSWDRNNTILVNLLRAIPEGAMDARATPTSPTIAQMFTHIHYVRLVLVEECAPEF